MDPEIYNIYDASTAVAGKCQQHKDAYSLIILTHTYLYHSGQGQLPQPSEVRHKEKKDNRRDRGVQIGASERVAKGQRAQRENAAVRSDGARACNVAARVKPNRIGFKHTVNALEPRPLEGE